MDQSTGVVLPRRGNEFLMIEKKFYVFYAVYLYA